MATYSVIVTIPYHKNTVTVTNRFKYYNTHYRKMFDLEGERLVSTYHRHLKNFTDNKDVNLTCPHCNNSKKHLVESIDSSKGLIKCDSCKEVFIIHPNGTLNFCVKKKEKEDKPILDVKGLSNLLRIKGQYLNLDEINRTQNSIEYSCVGEDMQELLEIIEANKCRHQITKLK